MKYREARLLEKTSIPMSNPKDSQGRTGFFGWCQRHPKTALFLFLFAILFALLFVIDARASRRLNNRLDAIRAAGEPLTADDLLARIPRIPDSQNRAVAVLGPIRRILGAQMSDEEKAMLPYIALGKIERPYRRWPIDVIDGSRAYLQRFTQERSELREALAMELGAFRPSFNKPLIIEVLLPELSEFLQVSRLLCLELRLHAEAGEIESVQARFHELLALDAVLNDSPAMISFLVQIAIRSQTMNAIEDSVNLNAMDAASLADTQAALSDAELQLSLVNAMLGERASFHNYCSWARSPRGGGITLKRNGDWVDWLPALSEIDEAKGLDIYDDYLNAARQGPTPKALAKLNLSSTTHATLPSYCLKSDALTGIGRRPIELWLKCVGHSRALQVALAAERFRRDRGSWPDKLDPLVPSYIAAVPKDPFDDNPIRYARVAEGIQTWSIAEDLTDNLGDIRKLARQREGKPKNDRPPDHGVMFLNPDLRSLPPDGPGP